MLSVHIGEKPTVQTLALNVLPSNDGWEHAQGLQMDGQEWKSNRAIWPI